MTIFVMIPARMQATRLPGKPLLRIGDKSMLEHCWQKALATELGPVVIAAGDAEIADRMRAVGADVIMTDPDLPSGSDRVWQAYQRLPEPVRSADPAGDVIVNLQGDLPFLEPSVVRCCVDVLRTSGCDIATPVTVIESGRELRAEQVVKAVCAPHVRASGLVSGRALYFTRSALPWGEGAYYHHIGLYVWRGDALARFVALPQGALEKREKLEQLRALEAGMHIEAVQLEAMEGLSGIDTPDDLARACKFYAKHQNEVQRLVSRTK